MIYLERIELDPKVCNGMPVIKGTRIPISVILEQLAEDESWDNLLAGYPELTKEQQEYVINQIQAFYEKS